MIDHIINEIIDREGGFVNSADDRGGPTNFGITQRTLTAWRKQSVTVDDVRNLTRDEAYQIYLSRYVTAPQFDGIADELLAAQVIDSGVLHGQRRAARWLQRMAGVRIDGRVGPVTLAAVNRENPLELGLRYAIWRIRFLGKLIAANARARARGETTRDQATFASGWMNRATEFQLEIVGRL